VVAELVVARATDAGQVPLVRLGASLTRRETLGLQNRGGSRSLDKLDECLGSLG
jgi:hypothetical protein